MPQTSQTLMPGDSYTVVSWQADINAQALQNAETTYPSTQFLAHYTQLPTHFSARVRETALAETAGAKSVYDKAKQLETFASNDEKTPGY